MVTTRCGCGIPRAEKNCISCMHKLKIASTTIRIARWMLKTTCIYEPTLPEQGPPDLIPCSLASFSRRPSQFPVTSLPESGKDRHNEDQQDLGQRRLITGPTLLRSVAHRRCARRRALREQRAMMVSSGLTVGELGSTLPSKMNNPGRSCAS